MADTVLKIDKIAGKSKILSGGIDIDSYDAGASVGFNNDRNATTSRFTNEISVSLDFDKDYTLKMLRAIITGETIGNVTIGAYVDGKMVHGYKLEKAFIDDVFLNASDSDVSTTINLTAKKVKKVLPGNVEKDMAEMQLD